MIHTLLHLSDFSSIGPRYNRGSDTVLFVHKGGVLVEIGGKSIMRFAGESLLIEQKQLHKISAVEDSEILLVYENNGIVEVGG